MINITLILCSKGTWTPDGGARTVGRSAGRTTGTGTGKARVCFRQARPRPNHKPNLFSQMLRAVFSQPQIQGSFPLAVLKLIRPGLDGGPSQRCSLLVDGGPSRLDGCPDGCPGQRCSLLVDGGPGRLAGDRNLLASLWTLCISSSSCEVSHSNGHVL